MRAMEFCGLMRVLGIETTCDETAAAIVRLTPEGLNLCEKLQKIGNDYMENSQKGMTQEEVATLRELMCKYIRNLDVMVANELPGMPIRPQHHHDPEEEHPRASGI